MLELAVDLISYLIAADYTDQGRPKSPITSADKTDWHWPTERRLHDTNEEEAADCFITGLQGFYIEEDRERLLQKIIVISSDSKTETSKEL